MAGTWLDTLDRRQQEILDAGVEDLAHAAEHTLAADLGPAAPIADAAIEAGAKVAERDAGGALAHLEAWTETHVPGWARSLMEHLGLEIPDPAAAPATGPDASTGSTTSSGPAAPPAAGDVVSPGAPA